MKRVFILWHTAKTAREEDSKLIGVYEDRDQAERAEERSKILPGFSDHPAGFEISEYEVGRDHWQEGFVSAEFKKKPAP